MKQSLREKCELLAENYTVINKDFKWEFEIMTIVAANTYTNAGMKADPEKMKECFRYDFKVVVERYLTKSAPAEYSHHPIWCCVP